LDVLNQSFCRGLQAVNHSISPEWKEAFTWAFDVPPKGQKLDIICKSKNTFGKVMKSYLVLFAEARTYTPWPSATVMAAAVFHLHPQSNNQ